MKKLSYFLFLFIVGAALNFSALAQDKKDTVKQSEPKENVKEETVSLNTVCPVSTEEIDDPVTVEHNGKTYAVCCKNCLKKFKKDPEKYISRLSEDGKSLKKGS